MRVCAYSAGLNYPSFDGEEDFTKLYFLHCNLVGISLLVCMYAHPFRMQMYVFLRAHRRKEVKLTIFEMNSQFITHIKYRSQR